MNKLITGVVNSIFKKLINEDKIKIIDNTSKIIGKIVSKIDIDMTVFTQQLTINNYKDLFSIIKLTIPYIDFSKMSSLQTLEQINTDPNISKMLFSFTGNNTFDINRNTDEMIDTIDKVINKLYVNWVNVFPSGDGSILIFNPDRDENKKEPIKKYRERVRNEVMTGIQSKYGNYKYFLTGRTYNSLMNGKYFKYLQNDTYYWYLSHAMNWVSQISFFHHFIHNKIMLVTGSTGAGKSTQVPKLLLYAVKVLSGKDGKIMCTQPRIRPAEDNCNTIANQMGVPLSLGEYFLQFQHSKKNHKPENIENHKGAWLRFVTDAILLNQVMKNVHLLDKEGKKSLYNVIIVDEVHEHNTNMDLILTLAKKTFTKNKSIKLVLISATLEADEQRYQTFFKNIADDIILDRRFDISIPGTGTQYPINEYYLSDNVYKKYHREVTDDFLDGILKRIVEILNNTPGDTLFFVTGEPDIKYIASKIINNGLLKNVLLLPYSRNISISYQDDINLLINTKVKQLKVSRSQIIKNFLNVSLAVNEPAKTFMKKLIISTNIAEASITLPDIVNVIDVGYRKISKYDIYFDIEKLLIEPISKSSQTQRKGRVGRIAPGQVYYLYSDDMISQSSVDSYGIVNENIHYIILKLLKDKFNSNGFTKDELIDEEGTFYIIHPDEVTITERDMKTGYIINGELPRIHQIFKLLLKLKLIDEEGNKTKLGIIVSNMSLENTDETLGAEGTKPIIAFLNSKEYKCEEELIFVLSALSSNKNVQDLFTDFVDPSDKKGMKTMIVNRKRGLSIFANKHSDHITLFNIYKRFNNKFKIKHKKVGKKNPPYNIALFNEPDKDKLELNIKKWTENNYIQTNKFMKILKKYHNIRFSLHSNFNKLYYLTENDEYQYNYLTDEIKLSSKIQKNILISIYNGYKNNIICVGQNNNIYHINVGDKEFLNKKNKIVFKNSFNYVPRKMLYSSFRDKYGKWEIYGITSIKEINFNIENKTFLRQCSSS